MTKNRSTDSMETPITNRGVDNTSNSHFSHINKGFSNDLNQFVLFDWFQATILAENFEFDEYGTLIGAKDVRYRVIELFNILFGIPSSDLIFENKGINGYNKGYSYKNIYIMYNDFRPDMGIHIKMSGSGCRDFENLNLDYYTLFRRLMAFQVNFNRIDISIDDFTNDYFTLRKLYKYVSKGLVSSKFLSCLNLEKLCLSDASNLGHTLQFGSKASNLQITFYDKLKERASQNMIVDEDIKYWTRTELRFRHEYAKQVVLSVIREENSVNNIVKSILSEYINFKTKNSNDSNISRRTNAEWWSRYLENVDRLKLTNYLPEDSITRKSIWLKSATAKTNLMVYLAELDNLKTDNLTSEYLIDLFQVGFDKFSYKDLQILNSHRVGNGLIPLTQKEVSDYIQDLRDKINIKEKNHEIL